MSMPLTDVTLEVLEAASKSRYSPGCRRTKNIYFNNIIEQKEIEHLGQKRRENRNQK